MWEDPQGVRDFITGPHGNLATNEIIRRGAGSQASKNPEVAMKWAGKLAPERVADPRAAVLQGWLQIRPEGAMNYARNLPAGQERDNAVNAVASQLIYQAPEQAAAWLRSNPDEEKKTLMDRYVAAMPREMRAKLEAAINKPVAN